MMNNNIDKKKSGMKYIYNPLQASFYMENHIYPLDTGVNPNTKKVWYKFSYDKTLEVYSKWCNRNK